MVYRLERFTYIPRPPREVFAFFADAHNLERITPRFLRFRIVKPDPIGMHAGARIDYELRLYGIRLRWKTVIEEFDPERSFVDVQLSGPYRAWRQRHEFVDTAAGTEMHDRVDYEMPFGLIGSIARWLFVRKALERVFDYRAKAIGEYFAGMGERT